MDKDFKEELVRLALDAFRQISSSGLKTTGEDSSFDSYIETVNGSSLVNTDRKAFTKEAENLIDRQFARCLELAHEWQASLAGSAEAMKQKADRIEYGVYGEHYHRGFYCPSPTELDLENVKRGRLSSNAKGGAGPRYTYYFSGDRMILCTFTKKRINEICELTEFITHEGNTEYGCIFDMVNGSLFGLTFFENSDDGIGRYALAERWGLPTHSLHGTNHQEPSLEDTDFSLRYDVYHYANGRIASADVFREGNFNTETHKAHLASLFAEFHRFS